MAEGIDLARVLVGLAMKSSGILLCPCPIVGALSNDACLRSVCLSVMYIGTESRTERPRKTKIDTEVAHVTRDSSTTFMVKRSKVNLQGVGGILWQPPAQRD